MCQNVNKQTNKQTDNGINQTNNYYINYDDNSLDEHDHWYDTSVWLSCTFNAYIFRENILIAWHHLKLDIGGQNTSKSQKRWIKRVEKEFLETFFKEKD